jgi:phage baseplate assembly protein V
MDAHDLPRLLGNLLRLGTVAEVDLGSARCRVRSGDLLTDFRPWLAPRAGQTIEWSAPSVGEQVLLLSPGGDLVQAIVLRGLYQTAHPAPSVSGTLHRIEYPDGAVLEYDHAAHALVATLPAGGRAEITAEGGVTVNGPLTVNGDSTFNGNTQTNGDAAVSQTLTAQTDVLGGGISLKGHRHGGVSSGSAQTGAPA